MVDDRHAVFPQITFFYIGNGSQEEDFSCQKRGRLSDTLNDQGQVHPQSMPHIFQMFVSNSLGLLPFCPYSCQINNSLVTTRLNPFLNLKGRSGFTRGLRLETASVA